MNTDTAPKTPQALDAAQRAREDEIAWIERERAREEREEKRAREKREEKRAREGNAILFPVHDSKFELKWGVRREAEIRAKLAEFEDLQEIENLQKDLKRVMAFQYGRGNLAICPVCDNAKPKNGFRLVIPGKSGVCASCAHEIERAIKGRGL